MRITGGVLRGRRLSCPRGRIVRPTTDRVREALFDILSSKYIESWEKVRVADLFAGTGALGLEALSRGTRACFFVEKNRSSLEILRKNLALAKGLNCTLRVRPTDVYSFLKKVWKEEDGFSADVVFADPPYAKGHMKRLLTALSRDDSLLADDAIIAIEEDKREFFSNLPGLRLLEKRVYGDTALFFIKRTNDR